ncbi:MAG: ABC transporter permease [Rhodothermaceae bacterium]|nr:ABC transporter permease [Bacteroidota bacterium]MXX96615.1 ABC transporter permease [Rhodothermaceae bacterium]MDE2646410.1 ABC transporter permease [Bacteroidota bacterium]MXZ57312.1 ABC transporter permease [Rhodothermaceae bacterium]MYB90649.1 ABC transporter permease [Rhodothermaceae bacterium]
MAGSLRFSLDPNRRAQLRALGLVAPLAIYIGITFLAPLGTMLTRSVYDPVVADVLPETLELLDDWDGNILPSEAVFAAAAEEIKRAEAERTLGQVAGRVNRVQGGLRSVLTRTARELRSTEQGPWRESMTAIDSAWADPETWYTIQITGERFTTRHYENALDLQRLSDGSLASQPVERRIYLKLFWRTLLVSTVITLLCLILGYPIAHLIARSPTGRANWLLILVLVPFWTSLLVRTTSWIVLLQTQGVLNDLMVAVGLISEEGRVAMVYNMTGTIVAMTHVLLPFMVLPLYSVMRGIPPTYMHAAASLGATPLQAFLRVYWPQSLPGVGAGGLLVFILAIGFYITPALVGGSDGQLISNMIAYHMQTSLNWGLAAALGGVLLVGVMALYLLYERLVGVERMGLG